MPLGPGRRFFIDFEGHLGPFGEPLGVTLATFWLFGPHFLILFRRSVFGEAFYHFWAPFWRPPNPKSYQTAAEGYRFQEKLHFVNKCLQGVILGGILESFGSPVEQLW